MKKIITTLLFGSVLVFSGCSSLNMPPQNEYTIASKIVSATNQRPQTEKTILVSAPIAAPGFQSRNMIYVLTPFELQSYTQSRWVAPPANMLSSVLVNGIEATHYFKAVVSPPFIGKTNYQLNTYLVSMDQSFLRPSSRVNLVLSATLVNAETLQVLAARTFVYHVDAPANNAYSGVIAANQAASWVSNQVARFVVEAVDSNCKSHLVSKLNVP
jgi:cholesterol transport system auxiliary component